jgi:tRNA nucleotidyltransferase/poly(A) polymerase
MDPATEALARDAIQQGAPATVSGGRVRDELLDLLSESPGEGTARMAELGLAEAFAAPLARADAELVARAAGAAARTGAQRRFAALAALVHPDPEALAPWVEDLHLQREDRDAVLRAARKAAGLAGVLQTAQPDSTLHALLHCEQPEVLALALALGADENQVGRYLDRLSGTRLEITGDDLRAAGVPESPAIGMALKQTLDRKLDGEVAGREDELAMALDIANRVTP